MRPPTQAEWAAASWLSGQMEQRFFVARDDALTLLDLLGMNPSRPCDDTEEVLRRAWRP